MGNNLTKREQIAAMAMAAILRDAKFYHGGYRCHQICRRSYEGAG